MFSMAIADLLMGFILIPQAYRESLINETLVDETELESNDTLAREHYFDEHFCRFLTAGTWLSVTTSIYTFTIVSFARYIATVHEELFNRYFPAETAHYSILPCWVFGLIQAIPLLTPWNDKTVSDFTTCSLPVKCEAWLTWSGVTVFYIPTTIIMVCYLLVLLKVRKEGISIARFAMILLNALCLFFCKVMQTAERRTEGIYMTFVLSILTLTFLLCWWPAVIYLIIKFGESEDSRAFYFGSMNSLLNPILFMGLNTTLRRKAKDFFLGIPAFFQRGARCKKDPASLESNVEEQHEPEYFSIE